MQEIERIAAEAAEEFAKGLPFGLYLQDKATLIGIIKAAIKKATETLRQDIRGLQEARWQEHRERESRAAHASGISGGSGYGEDVQTGPAHASDPLPIGRTK